METDNQPKVANIGAELSDSHPKVNPEFARTVQRQVNAPIAPEKKPDERPRDKTGKVFDPKKHFADQHGRPQFTKGGYFRAIPLRKQLKRAVSERLNINPPISDEPLPERAEAPSARAPEAGPNPSMPSDAGNSEAPNAPTSQALAHSAADVVTASIFTLAISRYGPSAKPLAQHEEAMQGAYRRYFEERNITQIPPWAEVAVATGSYALFVHAQSEQAKAEVGGFRAWIIRKIGKSKIEKLVSRFTKKKEDEESSADATR